MGKVNQEKALGQVIRQIRAERKMSQEALSFAADRDRTFVSNIERGMNSPSVRTLFRLAGALQTKPSVILARVEAMLPH
jgi:transcriptional regulator with XRE-family HTH domain